jgi:serine/threonine protein kinase
MQAQNNILNDRYQLMVPAGSGGMSVVYKAQDLALGRLVAVKVLHEGLTSDEEFLRRFQKEAHAVANLSHPNIVTVHDIGQDGRRYYIVMEYVEGWTLKQVIGRQGEVVGVPLALDRTLELSVQICAGIGYAHRSNLVHCDVKSQNVLVTRDGRVKVTDFGIARAMSETSLYQSGIVWGTPQYFSPEQAAGEPPSPASDVYSIGVIIFEMLTGRLPFEGDSQTALALKHMRATPPRPSEINPAVPEQMEQIVYKVLSKEPSGRYRTADQLGRVLTAYRENTLSETGPMAATAAVPVIEQKTAYHDPSPVAGAGVLSAASMATGYDYTARAQETSRHYPVPAKDEETDWLAITLGVLAIISWIGLVPLWYLVFLRYTG